ncbi:MAG: hypothetical protein CVT80_06450 [Alphaproteobacteria bacterium HGW-Alphaproteobacteria-2]|nr:MAG: hypothetical protein CVT80_06450 [Alphaproteobacteria bacterium HGW-Alphaproteobacteria-2]
MARRGSLSLGMRQRAGLMPALAESLAVLRMPLADLAEFLSREADENPLLDYRPPPLPAGGSGGIDSSVLAASESRGAFLRRQIAEQRLAPDVRAVADYLTEELSEEGFLTAPCDEIAARLGLPEALIAAGLAALQSCEPTGIGARDLGECLRLQLAEAGIAPAVATALTAHLPAAARKDWRAIARASGLPPAEIAAGGACLARLSPRPLPLDTSTRRGATSQSGAPGRGSLSVRWPTGAERCCAWRAPWWPASRPSSPRGPAICGRSPALRWRRNWGCMSRRLVARLPTRRLPRLRARIQRACSFPQA